MRAPVKGGKTIIQCKDWQSKVGVAAVRELYGVVQSLGANKGILCARIQFSWEAQVFAEEKPLELLDGDACDKLFAEFGITERIEDRRCLHKESALPVGKNVVEIVKISTTSKSSYNDDGRCFEGKIGHLAFADKQEFETEKGEGFSFCPYRVKEIQGDLEDDGDGEDSGIFATHRILMVRGENELFELKVLGRCEVVNVLFSEANERMRN